MNRLTMFFQEIFNKPEKALLFFVLPFALLTAIILPPFQAPDEHTHFYKAVQLSEGKLIGHRMEVKGDPDYLLVGDYLPERYKATADHYISLRLSTTEKVDHQQLKTDLSNPIVGSKLVPTPFENTVVYPPLSYIPQALAVFFTNIFTKNVLIQLYVARLVNVVVCIVILYFAVKRIPIGKWAVMLLATTPLAYLLYASTSGDGMTISLSVLFIAQTLYLLSRTSPITKKDSKKLVILSALLGFCKPPYLLLAGLVLAIPIKRFLSKKQFYLTVGISILTPLVIAGIWNIAVSHLYLNVSPGSNTSGQLHYIIHNPIDYIQTIARTYLGDAGTYVPADMIDMSAGLAIVMPLWFIVLEYLFIVIAILTEAPKLLTKVISVRLRVLSGLLLVIGFLAINTLLYVSYTAVGLGTIIGLQGRYFIPFVYLLIPALGGLLVVDKKRRTRLTYVIGVFIIFVSIASVVTLYTRYY